MLYQNASTNDFIENSDNQNVFKTRKIWGWGKFFRRDNSEEKKCRRQKYHSKINLSSKFNPNRTMGKW